MPTWPHVVLESLDSLLTFCFARFGLYGCSWRHLSLFLLRVEASKPMVATFFVDRHGLQESRHSFWKSLLTSMVANIQLLYYPFKKITLHYI